MSDSSNSDWDDLRRATRNPLGATKNERAETQSVQGDALEILDGTSIEIQDITDTKSGAAESAEGGAENSRADFAASGIISEFTTQPYTQLPQRELKMLRYQIYYATSVIYFAGLFLLYRVFGSFTEMGAASLLALPAIPLAAFALIYGPIAFVNGYKRKNRAEMVAASTSLAFWFMALVGLASAAGQTSALDSAARASQILWVATSFVSSVASIKVVKDLRKEIAHRNVKILGCHEAHQSER